MIDLTLNSAHDLDTSRMDLGLIAGAAQVKQHLVIKLKLWTGEWFLDEGFGTPYLQSILGKQLTLSGAIAALRKSIKEVSGVQSITKFAYAYDNTARKLTVTFTANTPYGLIEVTA